MPIAENISKVEDEIAAACRHAGRARDSVRLMAVSKMHPAAALLEAHAAGLRLFGENRVQEYAAKHPALASILDSTEVHLIGPLQSNKAARAAELFAAIDTLDSLRLAERLDKAAQASGKTLPVLIEIKLSPEPAKHGLIPESPELHQLLDRLPNLPHLNPRGLMTVPPWSEDPEPARPFFRRLRQLREQLASAHPRLSLDELSMGMSHDFAVAIEEGATTIRIGTAIFGARTRPIE